MNLTGTEKKLSEQSPGRKGIWLAWILLAAALMATAVATFSTKMGVEADAKREFDFACSEINLRIGARIEAHAQILRSASALFDASDGVTREEWHVFSSRQKVEQHLPGIQGVGFSLAIPRERLAQHVQEIRSQGFPDYTVKPAGDRETYTSIIYLEPFSGRNLRAFGYDMFSEPVRRAAMERARDSDAAAISGKVTLVQETDQDVQVGTLMYVPVYRKGMPTDTVVQRRKALHGWVYSPYRMNDLMQGILRGSDLAAGKRIRLQIFDDGQVSPDSLLYDSQPKVAMEPVNASGLTLRTSTSFNEHLWHLRFTQTSAPLKYALVYVALSTGTIISLLVFGLFISLINTRFRAQQLADRLTVDLRESEEKYRVIFSNEIYAICIFDLETPTLLDVNDAFCCLYGYRREELISGMTIHDITAEREISDSATKQAVCEGTIFIPLRHHRKKDGTVFPVEIVEGPYVWKGKKVMFALLHDISERVQGEEALRRAAVQMSEAQEVANMGSFSFDVLTNHHTTSTQLDKIFGFAPDQEKTPDAWSELLHPDDRKIMETAVADCLERGVPFDRDYRIIRRSDGQTRWLHAIAKAELDISGNVVRFAGVNIDITERKRAEESSMAAALYARNLIETSLDPLVTISNEGKITDVNIATEKITGMSRERLIDSDFSDYFTEPEMARAGYLKAFEQGQVIDYPLAINNASGSITQVLYNASVYRNEQGEVLGIFAAARDITERKRAEMALKQAHFELEERVSVRTEELRQANAYLQAEIAERKVADESLREVQRRLSTLMGNLPGMAYRCHNDRHRSMEFVSDGCLVLTGHSAKSLKDNEELSYADIIHPDDRDAVWVDVQQALDQRLRFELTYRIQTADGKTKWVWEQGMGVYSRDGALMALEGFIIDITAQKTAQATMVKYQQLSEHTHDIILFVRSEDGRIVEANQAACTAYGCDREELLAKTVYDIRADGQDMVIRHMKHVSHTALLFETIHKRRDGHIFPVEVRSCAAQISGETLLLSVVRDITERKRAEDAVRKSLREKESLLKEIHHRVKNNLQIVSSLLRLQSGQIDHPIAKAAMQDMQNRVHSMALIHEHLYRSENLAQVDMAAYLQSLCPKLMRTLAIRPDAIGLHLDLIPVHLEIDQAIPCGLLVNELVSNALKHAFPAGRTGVVRVELRPVDEGRKIQLRVIDNGVGLPADFDIKHLHSLGLELASDLTIQLRGRLEIGPGPGATFDVVFTPGNRMDSPRKSGDSGMRRMKNA